jgi:uncharacterized protein (DUF849 family)
MSKIIITCAVTGSIHTPSMSPYLPITGAEISEAAIGAAEAGAAILHLHARDPANGRPSADPAHFMGFLPQIKQRSAAVLNISTGGSATMTLEQRLAAPKLAEPEMCSLNMGYIPRRRGFPSGSMIGRSRFWKAPTIWCSRTRHAIWR